MKVWIVNLAVVLPAALLNLGSDALENAGVNFLEDAGVYVAATTPKFETRVIQEGTTMICTDNFESMSLVPPVGFEWHRFHQFERILQKFERGDNDMTATLRLGTPTIHTAPRTDEEFGLARMCKYLPLAYQSQPPQSPNTLFVEYDQSWEYFAVKVNDTERATIKKGWNYLLNLVTIRYPEYNIQQLTTLVVEQTASGEVYVGAHDGASRRRMDEQNGELSSLFPFLK